MKFINTSYLDFISKLNNRKIIQFGSSSAWYYYEKLFHNIEQEVVMNTLYVVDNSEEKQGKECNILGRSLIVKHPCACKNEKDIVILITVSLAYQESICKQLLDMNLSDDVECYSLPLMTYCDQQRDNSVVDAYFQNRTTPLIPKKIHSFWFSGDEKPELYKKCVSSWKKYCPDYEIIEWNSHNYDVSKNVYMKEAYENKKWAFVSDFARLDVIKEYGGIYMDMDVELLSSLDKYICADAFFCRQEDGMLELGSGFGAQKDDVLISGMLETYMGRRLIDENGNIDKTPQPMWLNSILENNNIYRCHDSQIINKRLILSNDYIMCPSGENSIENAKIGIHWHNGGWLESNERQLIKKSMESKQKVISEFFHDTYLHE